jgi:hypothetical protein
VRLSFVHPALTADRRLRRWRGGRRRSDRLDGAVGGTHHVSVAVRSICDLDRAGDGFAGGRAGAAARPCGRSPAVATGLLVLHIVGAGPWAAAAAVLAIVVMHLTRTFHHRPESIHSLSLVAPVAVGVCLLLPFASQRRSARLLAAAVVVTEKADHNNIPSIFEATVRRFRWVRSPKCNRLRYVRTFKRAGRELRVQAPMLPRGWQ